MANFNDSNPAAPTSIFRLGKWQVSGRDVSVYVPRRYDLDFFGGLWGFRPDSSTQGAVYGFWGTGNTSQVSAAVDVAPVDGWIRSMTMHTSETEQNGTALSLRLHRDAEATYLGVVLPSQGIAANYSNYIDAVSVKCGERFGFLLSHSGSGGGAAIRMVSGEFVTADGSSILGWAGKNATVAASTTHYLFLGADQKTATESDNEIKIGFDCTISKLFVNTASGQSATGTLVFTLRKNGAPTALTLTIPTTGGAGEYSDLTHAVAVSAGDRLTVEAKNNATAASATILSLTLKVLPTAATFPSAVPAFANTTLTGTDTQYYSLFSDLVAAPGNTDEIAYPCPIAGTLSDFRVQGGTSGNSDSQIVWELYKNGSPTGYKKTLTGDIPTAWFDADGGSEVSVAVGDLVWVQVSHTGAGTDPIFGICFTFEPDLT